MGNRKDQPDDTFPRRPRTFVPVYARPEPPVMQRPSLWEHWKAWVHYHSIQIRWDVERTLARRLRRPWRG